jgi:hypothetical protein
VDQETVGLLHETAEERRRPRMRRTRTRRRTRRRIWMRVKKGAVEGMTM